MAFLTCFSSELLKRCRGQLVCVYDYVELSHSGYEGEFNDDVSDDVVLAYYHLMRPWADLDVMKEVADGKSPLILQHYRVESTERGRIGPRAVEPDSCQTGHSKMNGCKQRDAG